MLLNRAAPEVMGMPAGPGSTRVPPNIRTSRRSARRRPGTRDALPGPVAADILPNSDEASVSLIVPAFREAGRLPPFLAELRGQLAAAAYTTEILVVDDGSPAAEQQALLAAVRAGTSGSCTVRAPLLLPRNTRKGGAIVAGWRAAGGRWRAFVDADGAVPAAEVRRVLGAVVARGDAAVATFAVRRRRGAQPVHRRRSRIVAGWLFARLAAVVAGVRVNDTQCGFKIVPAAAWDRIEARIAGSGFCFDVELLGALHRAGVRIEEEPIAWRERSGGHVRLWRDGGGMLRELWRLRRRLDRGSAADRSRRGGSEGF